MFVASSISLSMQPTNEKRLIHKITMSGIKAKYSREPYDVVMYQYPDNRYPLVTIDVINVISCDINNNVIDLDL